MLFLNHSGSRWKPRERQDKKTSYFSQPYNPSTNWAEARKRLSLLNASVHDYSDTIQSHNQMLKNGNNLDPRQSSLVFTNAERKLSTYFTRQFKQGCHGQ